MIIWLASYPRSGNSFFRRVSDIVFAKNIYSIYAEKMAPVTADDLRRFSADESFHIVKTHEMPSDHNKAIYLVRDGRDAVVSFTWFNLRNPQDPFREIPGKQFEQALETAILSDSFGGWSSNILAWTRRTEQTIVVRYEDLIRRPEEIVADAYQSLNIPVKRNPKKKAPTFEMLHSVNPYHFRQGKVNGWKEVMPDRLHDLFWRVHGEAMSAMGYLRSHTEKI